MSKQERIPKLVEELRHYFADVPLVMEAADTITDLLEVVEEYKEAYHNAQDLRATAIEKYNKLKAVRGVGKWIEHHFTIECSKCHTEFSDEVMSCEQYGWFWERCPKCGANMTEVIE